MKRLKSYLLLCPIAFLLLGYLIVTSITGSQAPLSQDRSQALARETFERVYGLTAEQSAACVLTDTQATETGYTFDYAMDQLRFAVSVNSADGSAECDPDAEAFRAMLEAPPKPDEASLAMQEWVAQRGGLSFDFWSLEDKATFAESYYKGSASYARYCGLPREDELKQDAAIEAAKVALVGGGTYTREALDAFKVATWFYRDAPAANGTLSYYEIVFWREASDGTLEYQTQADIDAASGKSVSMSELIGTPR